MESIFFFCFILIVIVCIVILMNNKTKQTFFSASPPPSGPSPSSSDEKETGLIVYETGGLNKHTLSDGDRVVLLNVGGSDGTKSKLVNLKNLTKFPSNSKLSDDYDILNYGTIYIMAFTKKTSGDYEILMGNYIFQYNGGDNILISKIDEDFNKISWDDDLWIAVIQGLGFQHEFSLGSYNLKDDFKNRNPEDKSDTEYIVKHSNGNNYEPAYGTNEMSIFEDDMNFKLPGAGASIKPFTLAFFEIKETKFSNLGISDSISSFLLKPGFRVTFSLSSDSNIVITNDSDRPEEYNLSRMNAIGIGNNIIKFKL